MEDGRAWISTGFRQGVYDLAIVIDLNCQPSEGVDKSDGGRKRSSVQLIKWKMLKLVAKKTVEKEQRDSKKFQGKWIEWSSKTRCCHSRERFRRRFRRCTVCKTREHKGRTMGNLGKCVQQKNAEMAQMYTI